MIPSYTQDTIVTIGAFQITYFTQQNVTYNDGVASIKHYAQIIHNGMEYDTCAILNKDETTIDWFDIYNSQSGFCVNEKELLCPSDPQNPNFVLRSEAMTQLLEAYEERDDKGYECANCEMLDHPTSKCPNPNISEDKKKLIKEHARLQAITEVHAFATITVTDPVTENDVEVDMFWHPSGGIFGIDSSFINHGGDFELADKNDDDSDMILFDPFINSSKADDKFKVRSSMDTIYPENLRPHYRQNALAEKT
jgi:hypothetical protein